MKHPKDSSTYFGQCHERWIKCANRDLSASDRPDEWVWNQCESCRYWISLAGKFSTDWGVCSSVHAQYDGRVRFAHDGCEQFEGIDS